METMTSYIMGEIPANFLKSALGRSLGVHGADAQKLAFYLLANPCLNPTGHYKLSLAVMADQTGITVNTVEALLALLQRLGFCTYHQRKQEIHVPLLTQIYSALRGPSTILTRR